MRIYKLEIYPLVRTLYTLSTFELCSRKIKLVDVRRNGCKNKFDVSSGMIVVIGFALFCFTLLFPIFFRLLLILTSLLFVVVVGCYFGCDVCAHIVCRVYGWLAAVCFRRKFISQLAISSKWCEEDECCDWRLEKHKKDSIWSHKETINTARQQKISQQKLDLLSLRKFSLSLCFFGWQQKFPIVIYPETETGDRVKCGSSMFHVSSSRKKKIEKKNLISRYFRSTRKLFSFLVFYLFYFVLLDCAVLFFCVCFPCFSASHHLESVQPRQPHFAYHTNSSI